MVSDGDHPAAVRQCVADAVPASLAEINIIFTFRHFALHPYQVSRNRMGLYTQPTARAGAQNRINFPAQPAIPSSLSIPTTRPAP